MLTVAITALTPMMIPNIVNAERILFRASARSARRKVFMKSIDALLSAQLLIGSGQGRQNLSRNQTLLDNLVTANPAITKFKYATCVLSDIGFVRHEYDCEAFLVVKLLQNLHDLNRGTA